MQNWQSFCNAGESPEKHGKNHNLAGLSSADIIKKTDYPNHLLKSFELADEMETVATRSKNLQKVRASLWTHEDLGYRIIMLF